MFTEYAPKNNIAPTIIKDFFTKDEIEQLHESVELAKKYDGDNDFYKPLILKKMSRLQIEIVYPQNIIDKLESFAKKITGEDVSLTHNSYLDYDGKYSPGNNPSLPPHFDSDNYYSKMTMDFQLDKNIDWAIVIEGKKFYLEVEDLLFFWGAGQIHWRENIILNENEKTEVLTFHFSLKEDHQSLNKTSRQQEERNSRLLIAETNPKMIAYKELWATEKRIFNFKQKQKKEKNE